MQYDYYMEATKWGYASTKKNLIFVSYDNKKNQIFFGNMDFDVELKM